MSNIDHNKDGIDEGKEEEVRSNNGQSQFLEMIQFDANAVSQQSKERNAKVDEDMAVSSNKSSSSRKRKL